jgi:hypothetical protein
MVRAGPRASSWLNRPPTAWLHGAVDVTQPPAIMIHPSPIGRPDRDSLQLTARQKVDEYAQPLASMVVELDALLPSFIAGVKQNLPAGVGGPTRDDAIAMERDRDNPFQGAEGSAPGSPPGWARDTSRPGSACPGPALARAVLAGTPEGRSTRPMEPATMSRSG